jgi:hypothetical protein
MTVTLVKIDEYAALPAQLKNKCWEHMHHA